MRTTAFLLLCVFLTLARPGEAGVLQVGAGKPFATIGGAVAASSDGDVILVATGSHTGFTVYDKGIAIVAEAFASVQVTGAIGVQHLAAGKTVVLDGLTVTGTNTDVHWDGNAVWVASCAGRVRVQRCILIGTDGFWTGVCNPNHKADGADAAYVLAAADVTFTQCSFRGGRAADLFVDPGPCAGVAKTQRGGQGLFVDVGSNVVVHDSTLRGGPGAEAWLPGEGGGNGAWVKVGKLFASGSEFEGAAGGAAWSPLPGTLGSAGGSGVRVDAPGVASLLDCAATGAVGGASLAGPGTLAPPLAGDGTLAPLAGVARYISAPQVLKSGFTLPLTFFGAAQDQVLLLLGTAGPAQPLSGVTGPFLLGSPLLGPIAMGSIVGPGVPLILPVTGPPLPGIVVEVWLQAVHVEPSGKATLTAARHVLLMP